MTIRRRLWEEGMNMVEVKDMDMV
jgi:hypothetical protein